MKQVTILSSAVISIVVFVAPIRTLGLTNSPDPGQRPQPNQRRQRAEQDQPQDGQQSLSLETQLGWHWPQNLPQMNTKKKSIVFQDVNLEDVIQQLAQQGGLNVIFDSSFRSRNITLDLRGATLRQALEAVLRSNQLFIEPVEDNTVIVAAENSANRARLQMMMTQTFTLKASNPQVVQSTLSTLFGGLVYVVPLSELRAVMVRTTPERMKRVETLIEKIDRRRPEDANIEVTVYLLAASGVTGEPLPPSLQQAIRRMKTPLPPERYRLLDMLFLRTRSGQKSTNSIRALAPSSQAGSPKTFYQVELIARQILSQGARQIIDFSFQLGAKAPLDSVLLEKKEQPEQTSYENTGIAIEHLDVPQGQPVIVGQAPWLQSGNPVLILLLARVVR